MPSWLLPVLLRRHVRDKGDPLCDKVLLLDANPSSAHIRHMNEREDTVSTSDFFPYPKPGVELVPPVVEIKELK